MRSFWGLIYDSFIRINGWLFGGLGLALSIATFFFSPETKFPVGWFVVLGSLSIVVVVVLYDASRTSWKASQRGLPAVRRTLEPPDIYQGIEKILIVEPSELFGVDALVSIYTTEEEYERLIGIGRVLNVQTNGYLQIGISTLTETSPDLIDKLKGNDSAFLKKILVKPSVPSYLLQER
jgi:hypothetical protein